MANDCKAAEIPDSQKEIEERVFSASVLRQEGYWLVPPGRAENSHWTQKDQIHSGGSEFRGLPQTLGFDHLANPPTPNSHWKPHLGKPLLGFPISMMLKGLKINKRKDHCVCGASALPLPLFLRKRSILGRGGGWGGCIHIYTPTYVFICLQWNQTTWKIPFYWLSSSGRIPPGNAFVQYVSYIMCPGPCRSSDMKTALVQQLMDETSSSRPHRLDP